MYKFRFFFLLIFILFSYNANAQWRSVSTEHFIIIHKADDREAVEEILGFAENIYSIVTEEIDSKPTHIRIIVNGDVDTYNGFYKSNPAYLELFITAPHSPMIFGIQRTQWLRILFIHELTHYVSFTYKKGFSNVMSYIFGPALRDSHVFFTPGWAIEGAAVHVESLYSSGGRGHNPYFEAYMKAIVLSNNPFTYYQAFFSSPEQTIPGGRHYIAGYYFISYLEERFGEGTFFKIYKEFLKIPLLGINRAIKKVTNYDGKSLFDEMIKKNKEKFISETEKFAKRNRTTPEGENYHLPHPNSSGNIYYTYSSKKLNRLISLNSDEKVFFNAPLSDPDSFTSTRDGILSVVAKQHFTSFNQRIKSTSDLYIRNEDIGNQRWRRLTHRKHLIQPAFSPDGSRLVAVQLDGSYSRLVEVNLDSGGVKTIFSKPLTTVSHPVFSHDGKELLFELNFRSRHDIWSLAIDDPESSVSLFGSDEFGDYYPFYDENGNVLFVSDREGFLALYSFNRKEKKMKRILTDNIGVFKARVNDDGVIQYQTYENYVYTIKSAIRTERESENIPFESSELPALPDNDKIEYKSRLYFELPYPLLWYPFVSFLGNYGVFGFGGYLYGASYFGSSFTVEGYYYPSLKQVYGYADFSFAIDRSTANYFFEQDFSLLNNGGLLQRSTHKATFSAPLFSLNPPGKSLSLEITTGASFIRDIEDTRSRFSFSDSLYTSSERSVNNYINGIYGITFLWSELFPEKALFGRGLFSQQFQGIIGMPFLTRKLWNHVINSSTWFHIPTVYNHIIALNFSFSHDTSGYSSYYLQPTGIFANTYTPSDLSIFYRAFYKVPLGIYDRPSGLATLTRLGLSFHFEGSYDLLYSSGDNFSRIQFYGGGGGDLYLNLWNSEIPLRGEISYRFYDSLDKFESNFIFDPNRLALFIGFKEAYGSLKR